jgi:hypothetical protein
MIIYCLSFNKIEKVNSVRTKWFVGIVNRVKPHRNEL